MTFLLNTFPFAVSESEPIPTELTVTIASGTVTSNLTNFPVMVRLSDMPSDFWTNVKEDGGDIRATTTGGTIIPHDLVWIDPDGEDGVLWVKITVSSGSDTSFKITCGNPSLDRLPHDDANGTTAVWSDYKAVVLMGIDGMNRATWQPVRVVGDPMFFEQTAQKQVLASWCHDGVTSDGTHRYIFNGNSIAKYDLTWTLVTSNSDPAGDSSISGLNDLGAGTVHNGIIYIPMGDNPGGTMQYIGKFSASDLSYIGAYDVTATAIGLAGLCVGPNGNLWGIVYGDGTELIEFDIDDGSVVSTLPLSITLTNTQGLEFWQGAFWLSVEDSALGSVMETYRVETDGTVTGGLYGSKVSNAGWPGLGKEGFSLLQADEVTNNSDERVRTFVPYDIALGGGGGGDWWADARVVADLASTGALGSAWSIGCTYSPSDNTQRTLMALCETGTGFTANVHVDVDDGNKIGTWDSSNSWLYTSPNVDPALDTSHRVNVVYNGTTARHIYHNGGSKGTDNTTTARGSGVGHLVLGAAREGDFTSGWRGKLGFAYARASVLPDAWIAAEYSNLNAPGSFYSVT